MPSIYSKLLNLFINTLNRVVYDFTQPQIGYNLIVATPNGVDDEQLAESKWEKPFTKF